MTSSMMSSALSRPSHDVRARLRLGQQEAGATANDDDAVVAVALQLALERKNLGLAVDQGDGVDSEGLLERRVLVEQILDDPRVLALLELDVDAVRVGAVGVVLEIADALDDAVALEVGDLLDDQVAAGRVGDLLDVQRPVAALLLLVPDARAQDDAAAPRLVPVVDSRAAADDAARGEVGARQDLHDVGQRAVRVADEELERVDHLAEVVRRQVARHADGDADRAVDQQVRELAGQDGRLRGRLVVVGREIDGVEIEVGQHVDGGRREARLGVSHGGRRVAVDRTEVALSVDQRAAHVERLRHAHERRVDDRLAVRVVVAGRVAGDLGALAELRRRAEVEVVHRHEDAALGGLEAVAHIGERARYDDAHRVAQVARLHLLLDQEVVNFVRRIATEIVAAGGLLGAHNERAPDGAEERRVV